jgi:nucleoside-diphosphate-sugar epimerase
MQVVWENAERLKGKSVNIGYGKQTSNKEVVSTLERIAGSKVEKTVVEGMRRNDSETWVSDTTLLRSYGWKPLYTLEDALRNTYENAKEFRT